MKSICGHSNSEGEETPPLLNSFSDGGVNSNSALKRRNDGRICSHGIYFWDNGSGSICPTRKTYKDFKRKRNSRRELQGRVMHCSKLISYGEVEQNRE